MNLKAFLVAFMVIEISFAWSANSHFLIAAIAESELTEKNPILLAKLIDLLKVLKDFTSEGNHIFVECSSFADEIKSGEWRSYDQNHFYNGYVTKFKDRHLMISQPPKDKSSILTGVRNAIKALKNKGSGSVNDRLGKSIELRMLIHFIGDLHQPLHVASRITDEFPEGDKGGNLFSIDHFTENLHGLWDNGFVDKYSKWDLPFSDKNWEAIQKIAKRLIKNNPKSSFQSELEETDYWRWIKEIQKLALGNAYSGIEKDGKPSLEYMQSSKKIVETLISLAGYRLADLLIREFSSIDIFEDKFSLVQKTRGKLLLEAEMADAPMLTADEKAKNFAKQLAELKNETPEANPENHLTNSKVVFEIHLDDSPDLQIEENLVPNEEQVQEEQVQEEQVQEEQVQEEQSTSDIFLQSDKIATDLKEPEEKIVALNKGQSNRPSKIQEIKSEEDQIFSLKKKKRNKKKNKKGNKVIIVDPVIIEDSEYKDVIENTDDIITIKNNIPSEEQEMDAKADENFELVPKQTDKKRRSGLCGRTLKNFLNCLLKKFLF